MSLADFHRTPSSSSKLGSSRSIGDRQYSDLSMDQYQQNQNPPTPTESLPKATLQNNIGSLLLLKNSPSAAKERFYASIATNGAQSNEILSKLVPQHICPKIDVEPPGLIWFERKLLKEVLISHCNPRNDDLETRVPLGLEYYQYPIRTVTRSPTDARIAAGVNLALILFREAESESDTESSQIVVQIEQVISVLKWALALDGNGGTRNSDEFDRNDADPLLLAIAHTNMGVLRFIQDNSRAAMHNFEKSHTILSSQPPLDPLTASESGVNMNMLHMQQQPCPMDYLRLTIMLNHTRAAILTNDERSSQLCDALCTTASSITCQHTKSFYRIKWLTQVALNYIPGLRNQREEHFNKALECYNTILSATRKEWGHDHIHVAAILEKGECAV
jgi:hypothetical protein